KRSNMAKLEQLSSINEPRVKRYFSDEFKRRKVDELERRLISIAEICKQYEVSATAVYKWIYKYSLMRKKSVKMVVEAESDTAKIKALQQQIKDLEQMLGKKQFEIEFMTKQIEIARDEFDFDLKKKLSGEG
ncbi:transposase, partial [Microcoleus sp. AT8-B6]|uniref:transposase n=1 Tax=Microcoleus sp. AT8-B6 TaxID=2818622 RepID=UPI002FD55961